METTLLLLYILTGVFIGVISELFANLLSLWHYRKPWLAYTNILFMFGIMSGCAAFFSPSPWIAFAIATVIGTVYEIINYKITDWWSFPNNTMGTIKGIVPICITLAFAWGSIPLLIHYGLQFF